MALDMAKWEEKGLTRVSEPREFN